MTAVLQDASKSYVAFLLLCTSVRCGHRGLGPMPVVARLCLRRRANVKESYDLPFQESVVMKKD